MDSRDGVRMKNRGEEVEPLKKNKRLFLLVKDLQPRKSNRIKPGRDSPTKINYLILRILQ